MNIVCFFFLFGCTLSKKRVIALLLFAAVSATVVLCYTFFASFFLSSLSMDYFYDWCRHSDHLCVKHLIKNIEETSQ